MEITNNEYQLLSNRTAKTSVEHAYSVINAIENKPAIARVLISALKLNSESGELADALVKHLAYGQTLDVENIVEECGDLLWYIADILTALDYDISEVMVKNIDKLRIRYPEKFTEKDAVERKDKTSDIYINKDDPQNWWCTRCMANIIPNTKHTC